MLLDDFDEVPYKVLNFLGSEINYGGRVTDDKDVRLIKNILIRYMNPEMLKDGYKLSESGIYYSPAVGDINDYMTYIDSFPLNPAPEAFGLHDNAEITNA
jgi:dynein heavy chain